MKKILKNLVIICFLFFVFIGSPKAVNDANARGGSDYSGSTGTGCTTAGVACGMQTAHRIKVRLVYYDGANEELLAGPTMIEPNQWGWYTVGNEYTFNSDSFEKTVVGNNNDPEPEKRRKLQQFVNNVGWNVNLNTLNKTSCEVDRKGNCYGKAGYRVIAELYIGLSEYAGQTLGTDYQRVKGMENDKVWLDVPSRGIFRGTEISDEMRIAWADINYHCQGNGKGVCNKKEEDLACLLDPKCGYGIWIVDISKALSNNNDYSLDSACVGCDRQGKNNVSYIIQDVDNWKYLEKLNELDNSDLANKKVQNYFTKGIPGQLCREEYHISFPDQSKVHVESGGYFTINEDVATNNFKPIHVERTIKCKTNDGRTLSNGDTNKLKSKYCNSDTGDAGKVKIWYSEVKNNGTTYPNGYTYGWNDMKKVNSGCGISRDSDGAAVLVVSSDYRLNENVYRYIRKGTAKPTSSKSDGDAFYTTLKHPNFPVHFDHKATSDDELAGKISVRFDFPDDSNMGEAFESSDNSFLLLKGQETSDINKANIYKRYSDEPSKVLADEIDSITIKNSACAKMFGFDSADFKKCVEERKNSAAKKISICRSQNNASNFATYTLESGKRIYKGYTCDVLMNPDADGGKCNIIHASPVSPYMGDKNETKYIGSDGKVVSKVEFTRQCCNEFYKDLGFDDDTCSGSGPVCNKDNVGKGAYEGYIWSIKKSTGQEGCCSPDEIKKNECQGKPPVCTDGVDGTCGPDKKCVCDADNKCPNDHENGECPTNNTCEHSGSTYKINGQTVDKEKYISECCNSSADAGDLGLEWNENNKVCCAEGEKYNPLTGTCVNKFSCDTCESAELCCDPNGCGQFYYDKTYCDKQGSKWDGSKCLICSGKPMWCDNPSCSDELVYRPVALKSPFIGQEGYPRNTGANWAAASPDGRFYDVSNNNPIVKSVITDKSNDDSHVMYKFTLDSDLIDDIRKYNSDQKSSGGYSDFTLKCSNGANCKSEFIKNIIPNEKKSGRCLDGSTDPICR